MYGSLESMWGSFDGNVLLICRAVLHVPFVELVCSGCLFCRACLIAYTALLIVCRALLIVCGALLIVCRALLIVCRALLIVYKALLIVCRALLIVFRALLILCRALLIVSRALLYVPFVELVCPMCLFCRADLIWEGFG